MSRINRVRIVVVGSVAVAALGLAGCGGHDSGAGHSGSASSTTSASASTSTGSSANASAADIAFVEMMIPHHEQAIEMSDLALAPKADASEQVRTLATQIKDAQGPEIAQMEKWLKEWGVESSAHAGSEGASDHAGSHDAAADGMDSSMGSSMDSSMGMLTAAQMTALSEATGTQFDTLWLQGMIAHHEGAIAMAEDVKAQGTNPEVAKLAEAIIAGQQSEIDQMQQLLAQGQ